MGKKFKVTEGFKIPTGHYFGKIVEIQYREEPYEYTDFVISVNLPGAESNPKLTVGFPSFITASSKLGDFVRQVKEFKVGDELELEPLFLNKDVEFDITNTPGKKDKTKTYSNIASETLKIVK